MNYDVLNEKVLEDINDISKYLAVRDLENLNINELKNRFNIEKVDLIILLGNSIIYSALKAFEAFNDGIANKLMIVGGIGHSTEILRNNIKKSKKYSSIKVENRSEADILKDIAIEFYCINEEDIILENKSTNCGDNAFRAFEILKEMQINANSIILIQDPTMQLRSYASFRKYFNRNITFINYAPIIPKLLKSNSLCFEEKDIEGLWEIERFLSLLVGEIPRLFDDEQGYGPKGKNFIFHVEVPKYIYEAYKRVILYLDGKLEHRSFL